MNKIDELDLLPGAYLQDTIGSTLVFVRHTAPGRHKKVVFMRKPNATKGTSWYLGYLSPISLTPNWLEKLGFEIGLIGRYGWEDGSESFQFEHPQIEGISLYHNTKFKYWTLYSRSGQVIDIYFVHNLQLVFRALYNVSLTLTNSTTHETT